ncbi:hypothetical protein P171DRAFT_428475 [Karstenula rhodostoma CBS 690.94]|uniref:Secreted protein n=1 Tax=Karstenula rhodostoma CBS 690.94 TaxID=1392251 RepID=A0A9P4UGC8_9PLEO|nr:hypothetical protein P171DRAFT_428475 [Karstenula rhodostoma CBS 690.94]
MSNRATNASFLFHAHYGAISILLLSNADTDTDTDNDNDNDIIATCGLFQRAVHRNSRSTINMPFCSHRRRSSVGAAATCLLILIPVHRCGPKVRT